MLQRKIRNVVRAGLRVTGIEARGMRNALEIGRTELTFSFPDLPPEFDGYRLLHLTDLHLGFFTGLTERIVERITEIEAELCVITGDYRPDWRSTALDLMPSIEAVIDAIRASEGIISILGNHDPAALAEPLASLGVAVLANRTHEVSRGAGRIRFVGIDDRRYRRSRAGLATLAGPFERAFPIALVHSPRYAIDAARAGIRLYLCGHTHAGQVCLPGSLSVYRPQGCWTRMSGPWRVGDMQGYTSAGAGVSMLPIRFNCPGEITRITLRRGAST